MVNVHTNLAFRNGTSLKRLNLRLLSCSNLSSEASPLSNLLDDKESETSEQIQSPDTRAKQRDLGPDQPKSEERE